MMTKAGWHINCDTPGCGNSITSDNPSKAEARKEVKEDGWNRVRGKDLCPYCSKELTKRTLQAWGVA